MALHALLYNEIIFQCLFLKVGTREVYEAFVVVRASGTICTGAPSETLHKELMLDLSN